MVRASLSVSFSTVCTQLHSKIIISDLSAFFLWSLMVKVRGQKFEQEQGQTDGWKWPKNLGWRQHGQYCINGARCQEFEAAELSWIRPGVLGSLRWVAYELIPDDHKHVESLACPCIFARWHHWRHKCSHVPFFCVCLTFFPFEFFPRTFTIGSCEKKSIRSELMILECSFPLTLLFVCLQLLLLRSVSRSITRGMALVSVCLTLLWRAEPTDSPTTSTRMSTPGTSVCFWHLACTILRYSCCYHWLTQDYIGVIVKIYSFDSEYFYPTVRSDAKEHKARKSPNLTLNGPADRLLIAGER